MVYENIDFNTGSIYCSNKSGKGANFSTKLSSKYRSGLRLV